MLTKLKGISMKWAFPKIFLLPEGYWIPFCWKDCWISEKLFAQKDPKFRSLEYFGFGKSFSLLNLNKYLNRESSIGLKVKIKTKWHGILPSFPNLYKELRP